MVPRPKLPVRGDHIKPAHSFPDTQQKGGFKRSIVMWAPRLKRGNKITSDCYELDPKRWVLWNQVS